jgi:hypothetical protein
MLTIGTRSLAPEDEVRRTDLHEHLGGQQQSGISPSSRAPVVMIFSDPASGEQHGYFDGWNDEEGLFHYSGEGQRGDQQMTRGNKAIRDHQADGRSLQVFLGSGKGRAVTYAGEFEYVDHYETEAPETNNGPVRTVIKFRLRPVEDRSPAVQAGSPLVTPGPETVDHVPIEQHSTETTFIDPEHEPYEAERREARLLKAYEQHLKSLGHRPHRHRIRPEGEAKPLFTDLYDPVDQTLIEAKGTTTREAIRMAIGQLSDYRRFVTDAQNLAVLVPAAPRPDLVELVNSCNVSLIYPDESGEFA